MADTIEQLRIYKTARSLEDQIYELVKTFPASEYYGIGNDLRRSSAAVSHYVREAHRLYSYRMKLDALTYVRREAEITQRLLDAAVALGARAAMIEDYTGVIKQSWGLTKWLKVKLSEKQLAAEVSAKDDLVLT
jgi:four helix bundle protein